MLIHTKINKNNKYLKKEISQEDQLSRDGVGREGLKRIPTPPISVEESNQTEPNTRTSSETNHEADPLLWRDYLFAYFLDIINSECQFPN